jgi:hypothetical protein
VFERVFGTAVEFRALLGREFVVKLVEFTTELLEDFALLFKWKFSELFNDFGCAHVDNLLPGLSRASRLFCCTAHMIPRDSHIMIPRETLTKARRIGQRVVRFAGGAAARAWFGISAGLTVFCASAMSADWHAESLPQYDRLFESTNGWIGADGDFTVALTNGLTLWLFSDTFIGHVRDGHRVDASMVNNSAAWQHGSGPAAAAVEFFHRVTPDGKPAALITPADGKGWFWLADGIVAGGALFVFLPQIERTDDKSVFGFRQIGTCLGRIANPLAPPTQWKITQSKVPFARFGSGEDRSFGSALLATSGFVYIFGTHDRKNAGRMMILARAPEANLDDFAAWQFRTRDGWSANVDSATDLCDRMATEYSVSWLPSSQRFVLICTLDGMSEKIIARTAIEPWGPWSAETVVFRCPEAKWDKDIFCYSAKAHPMLASAADELLVSYAANSFEFSKVLADARLYWPRFVRVKPSVN